MVEKKAVDSEWPKSTERNDSQKTENVSSEMDGLLLVIWARTKLSLSEAVRIESETLFCEES